MAERAPPAPSGDHGGAALNIAQVAFILLILWLLFTGNGCVTIQVIQGQGGSKAQTTSQGAPPVWTEGR